MKVVPKKGGAAHDKDKAGDPSPVKMPWEAALAALGSGAYDVMGNPKEDRGPDLPGAQSPAPGVDPVGGKESAAPGDILTNVARSPVVVADEADSYPDNAARERDPAALVPARGAEVSGAEVSADKKPAPQPAAKSDQK